MPASSTDDLQTEGITINLSLAKSVYERQGFTSLIQLFPFRDKNTLFSELLTYLSSNGLIFQAFCSLSKKREQAICQHLFEAYASEIKPNVNKSLDENGNTLLHQLAAMDTPESIIDMLIDAGGDVHQKNSQQLSPLDLALEKGNLSACVAIYNKGGLTAEAKHQIFLLAAKKGDLSVLLTLLKDGGIDINHQDKTSKKDTALHLAGVNGHVDVVRELLARGASRTILNNEKRVTAIVAAAKASQWDVVRLYCDSAYKEDSEHNSNYGYALMVAARENAFDMISSLLDAGAAVNWYDVKSGNRVLHYAVIHKAHDALALLLKAGSDVSPKNKEGKTALDIALEANDLEAIKAFIESGKLTKAEGNKALYYLAGNGELDLLKVLLTSGNVDINYQDPTTKNTALHIAGKKGHVTVAKELLARGASRKILNNEKNVTAIVAAARAGQWDVVRLYCDSAYKEDSNHNSNYGYAMMIAARENAFDMIGPLDDANAQATWHDGNTKNRALHYAVIHKAHDALAVLLKAGANVSAKNKEGLTALDIALKENDLSAIKVFVETGKLTKAEGNKALYYLAEKGELDLLKALLDSGNVDVNYQDPTTKNTALHIAGKKGHVTVAKELLARGASRTILNNEKHVTAIVAAAVAEKWDVVRLYCDSAYKEDSNHKSNYGSALLTAARQNVIAMISPLIAAGAQLTWYETDTENRALHHTVMHKAYDAMAALLKAGADVSTKNKEGQTALDIALKANELEAIKVFIESGKLTKAEGNKALYYVAEKGELDLLKVLLTSGNININYQDPTTKNTALHIAGINGHVAVVKELLARGAKRNIKNNEKHVTAIVAAANLQKWDIVRLYGDSAYKEDSNHNSNYGSAMLAAARDSAFDVVISLLNNGAQATWHDVKTENRALHYAVIHKAYDALAELLKADADVGLKNKEGQTALDIAISEEDDKAITVFAESSKLSKEQKECVLDYAYRHKLTDVFDILAGKAGVSIQDEESGDTILHLAVRGKDKTAVAKMIREGYQLISGEPKSNKLAYTPFQLALSLAENDIAQLFIDNGRLTVAEMTDYLFYKAVLNEWDKVDEMMTAYPSKEVVQMACGEVLIRLLQHRRQYQARRFAKHTSEHTLTVGEMGRLIETALLNSELHVLEMLFSSETIADYFKGEVDETLLSRLLLQAVKQGSEPIKHALFRYYYPKDGDNKLGERTEEIISSAGEKSDVELIARMVIAYSADNQLDVFKSLGLPAIDSKTYQQLIEKPSHYISPTETLLKMEALNQESERYIRLYQPSRFHIAHEDSGDTVLHEAVRLGKVDFACRSLGLGLDPLKTNRAGQTPMELAILNNDDAMVLHLLYGYYYLYGEPLPTKVTEHLDAMKALASQSQYPTIMNAIFEAKTPFNGLRVAVLIGDKARLQTVLDEMIWENDEIEDAILLAVEKGQSHLLPPLFNAFQSGNDFRAKAFDLADSLNDTAARSAIDESKELLLELSIRYQVAYEQGEMGLTKAKQALAADILRTVSAADSERVAELVLWVVKRQSLISYRYFGSISSIFKEGLTDTQMTLIDEAIEMTDDVRQKITLLDYKYYQTKLYASGIGNTPIKKAFVDTASRWIDGLVSPHERSDLYELLSETETASYGYREGQTSNTTRTLKEKSQQLYIETIVSSQPVQYVSLVADEDVDGDVLSDASHIGEAELEAMMQDVQTTTKLHPKSLPEKRVKKEARKGKREVETASDEQIRLVQQARRERGFFSESSVGLSPKAHDTERHEQVRQPIKRKTVLVV